MNTAPLAPALDPAGPAARTAPEPAEPAAPLAPPATVPLPAAPAAPARTRGIRWHVWAVLGITLLGVVLRYVSPERPLLWGDDAYTVYRTHADYQSMLDILQNDGFTPLHYQLYFLQARVLAYFKGSGQPTLTPAAVRFLPAFWGSLMAPAMYFLAVQLVRRRTALAAALFAACSAYLLGYSRDGKMYMMLWSMTALSTACLLWWFRSGRRTAWLAWVASGLAMTSAHMTGPAMLPFQAIFFLTRSKVHWKDSILFVFGLAVMLSGPLTYKETFNAWAIKDEQHYGFDVEGLGWVVPYNRGRTGPDLVQYSAPAYLFSWEWPKKNNVPSMRPWVYAVLSTATVGLLLLAAVGALPWSARLRGVREGADFPVESPGGLDEGGERPPQPWWRVFLWLGLWIVIPVYFVYCRSMTDFVSPKAWWESVTATIAGPAWRGPDGSAPRSFWVCLALATAVVAALTFLLPRFRRAMLWLFPGLAGAALLLAVLHTGAPSATAKAEWTVRLTEPLRRWWDWMTADAMATALVVVLPGLVVYYCGRTWGQRLKRTAQFVVVAAVILGACVGVHKAATAVFNDKLQTLMERRGMSESQAIAALEAPGGEWQTIFMPRYFGFVWVGFCVALVALYMRLPTRPLRVGAMAVLIGINLAVFAGRLYAGTEPPLDRVAADIWKADVSHNKADGTTRVYVNDGLPRDESLGGAGHPGWGRLEGQQGKYYLGLERGYWLHPLEWKRISAQQQFEWYPRGGRGGGGLSPSTVAGDVRANTQIKRVIVWDKVYDAPATTSAPGPQTDAYLSALGAGWKRVGEAEDFAVRFHWEWRELYTFRRTEYVRGQ